MISNFKLFQYFNLSQNFIQNVQKQKKNLCPELTTSKPDPFDISSNSIILVNLEVLKRAYDIPSVVHRNALKRKLTSLTKALYIVLFLFIYDEVTYWKYIVTWAIKNKQFA